MIDGADNNDDVVGGPLQNVTQESVQEFQIATNRFSAESGRSAASVINIITKSGTDQFRGSASLFLRDDSWQAQPAISDGDTVPFDRQQLAGAAGGPLRAQRLFWFGAMEYRNQDGAIPVGARDVASRTIRQSFAAAPLDDLLASGRIDWRPNAVDGLTLRYAAERADDTSGSTLDRSIGSASQRQASENRYQSIVGSWTRIWTPTLVNVTTASFSTFKNVINPLDAGPQLTFPSIQDGTSFRVPQGTTQKRFQLANSTTLVRGAHTLRMGGEWQSVHARFDLGVFQEGRIEFIQDFAGFDHNGDGRVDDGDLLFSVTLRSGKPDQDLVIDDADNNHIALFVQDDWRIRPDLTLNLGLRYEIDTDVKNISRVDEINPIVQPFLVGERKRDLNNYGPRIGFNWAPGSGQTSVHGGYGIYYDRVTLQIESLERGLDGRALPIEVRAGNVFFLDQATGQFPPFAPSTANPFTGFILPGAGASGINIIDNGLAESDGAAVQPRDSAAAAEGHGAARRRRPQPRDALHHRADDRGSVQSRGRRARPGREPRIQRAHALRRAARQRRAAWRAVWIPFVVRPRQGVQLRQRRSDSLRERPDRSQRPAPANSGRRRTISVTASRSPAGSRRPPGSSSRRS